MMIDHSRHEAVFKTLLFAFLACGALLVCDGAWGAIPQPENPGELFSTPLNNLLKILRGPVAISLAMAGIIATGIALIFGGEMRDFVKTMITITLVLCVVIFSTQIIAVIFGIGNTDTIFVVST